MQPLVKKYTSLSQKSELQNPKSTIRIPKTIQHPKFKSQSKSKPLKTQEKLKKNMLGSRIVKGCFVLLFVFYCYCRSILCSLLLMLFVFRSRLCYRFDAKPASFWCKIETKTASFWCKNHIILRKTPHRAAAQPGKFRIIWMQNPLF